MNAFALLSKNQNQYIERELKKFGLTDFAKLQGGGSSVENQYDEYWLSGGNTNKFEEQLNSRNVGIRLAINYNEIEGKVIKINKKSNHIFEIEFGEYPQSIASNQIQEVARKIDLEETGKIYHINGRKITDKVSAFLARSVIELRLDEKKIIQMKPNISKKNIIINNKQYSSKKTLFIEVKPLRWLVFEELGIAVTKDIIASGVKFEEVKYFIENYLFSEITDSIHEAFEQDIIRKISAIKQRRELLLKELNDLKYSLSIKSDAEIIKEIDKEFRNEYGVSQKEFERILKKLYKYYLTYKVRNNEISVLEQLKLTLLYLKGVSLEELTEIYAMDQEKLTDYIKQTRKIIEVKRNW